jgi:hypothetical protein
LACKFLFDKRLQSTQTGGDLQGNNDHKSLFSIDLYVSQKAYFPQRKEVTAAEKTICENQAQESKCLSGQSVMFLERR